MRIHRLVPDISHEIADALLSSLYEDNLITHVHEDAETGETVIRTRDGRVFQIELWEVRS